MASDQRTDGPDHRRQQRRGRGAVSSPPPRYEPTTTVPVDDGWETGEAEIPNAVATTLTAEACRSIITSNDSPDIPFSHSLNPYRGCEHGCVYCFARPSHAYIGLSPGLDFETKLFFKRDAAQRLREALMRPRYRPTVIALGANTDPYQPVERHAGVTRELLEVLWEYRHPVSIVTKSALVLRDLDLLRSMAAQQLVGVHVSLTTLDNDLARVLEPRAPTPQRRLRTIRALSQAGVPVGVLASPMIPALNDHELEQLLAAAATAGATHAGYALVRLARELRKIFTDWLDVHFPQRKEHVLSLIRQCRGGQLNQAQFGRRMRGEGVYAELLDRRFDAACNRLGLGRKPPELDLTLFRRSGPEQLLLLK